MARPNYKFKKRQKELKKQKKREEKLLRKHGKKDAPSDLDADAPEGESPGHASDAHEVEPLDPASESGA